MRSKNRIVETFVRILSNRSTRSRERVNRNPRVVPLHVRTTRQIGHFRERSKNRVLSNSAFERFSRHRNDTKDSQSGIRRRLSLQRTAFAGHRFSLCSLAPRVFFLERSFTRRISRNPLRARQLEKSGTKQFHAKKCTFEQPAEQLPSSFCLLPDEFEIGTRLRRRPHRPECAMSVSGDSSKDSINSAKIKQGKDQWQFPPALAFSFSYTAAYVPVP